MRAIAAMVETNQPIPMTRSTPNLRQQLVEARNDVLRQIEILQAGPASLGRGGEFIDNTSLIANLSNTLHEIEDGLAGLESDDG